MIKDDQYNMAVKYGYVESMGGEGVAKGSLVPYDDLTSSLSRQEQEEIRFSNNPPGVIYPKRGSKQEKK
jgi:hypothetical protein